MWTGQKEKPVPSAHALPRPALAGSLTLPLAARRAVHRRSGALASILAAVRVHRPAMNHGTLIPCAAT